MSLLMIFSSSCEEIFGPRFSMSPISKIWLSNFCFWMLLHVEVCDRTLMLWARQEYIDLRIMAATISTAAQNTKDQIDIGNSICFVPHYLCLSMANSD